MLEDSEKIINGHNQEQKQRNRRNKFDKIKSIQNLNMNGSWHSLEEQNLKDLDEKNGENKIDGQFEDQNQILNTNISQDLIDVE